MNDNPDTLSDEELDGILMVQSIVRMKRHQSKENVTKVATTDGQTFNIKVNIADMRRFVQQGGEFVTLQDGDLFYD